MIWWLQLIAMWAILIKLVLKFWQAAERLKITAQEHYKLKIADGIIPVSIWILNIFFIVIPKVPLSYSNLVWKQQLWDSIFFFLVGIHHLSNQSEHCLCLFPVLWSFPFTFRNQRFIMLVISWGFLSFMGNGFCHLVFCFNITFF